MIPTEFTAEQRPIIQAAMEKFREITKDLREANVAVCVQMELGGFKTYIPVTNAGLFMVPVETLRDDLDKSTRHWPEYKKPAPPVAASFEDLEAAE